jgi:cytochrome oxidase Cu insertion factor (SCO1/SenC/PrrC family)
MRSGPRLAVWLKKIEVFEDKMKPGIIHPGEIAPDFELTDTQDRLIRLSDYRGKPVVLAFLRGFM